MSADLVREGGVSESPWVPPSNRPAMSDPRGIIGGMGKKVSDGRKRAFKFRFYPSPAQATFLGRSFGAKRWVWNKSLGLRMAAYAFDGTRLYGEDLINMLPAWRKNPDMAWLGEVSSVVLQQTLRDQDRGVCPGFVGGDWAQGVWKSKLFLLKKVNQGGWVDMLASRKA